MAERCAGEDLALGAVCVMRALTINMDWARLKVYGEQRQPIIHKLSSEQKMIQVEKISRIREYNSDLRIGCLSNLSCVKNIAI